MSEPKAETIELIKKLVSFDTTSRNSNLELIEFVRGELDRLGVTSELVYDRERRKANLFATLGPADRGGIVLSGHTDVVPVDGQSWDTDPYAVVEREGRLYGRGTSDMKSFIAVSLAYAPQIIARNLETPVHFSFSYDEEVGCVGVRGLLDELARRPVKPTGCIVGEPTRMEVVRAHKGKLSARCCVHGLECHSGLAHRGVNAVEAAAETVAFLKAMARRFRDQGPYDGEYDPPYTTVHTGVMRGGTALNIVPKECSFEFEFRYLPEQDPQALLAEVRAFTERRLLPEMQAVSPQAGFEWEELSGIPGLSGDAQTVVVGLAQHLTGSRESGKVSFGTEAGLFEQAGIPAVVCGPGSIAQAHKPNEFIDREQIARCEAFVEALLDRLGEGPGPAP